MTSYSQGSEQFFVQKHFLGRKIRFLSIGENDGVTFSNVRGLALDGASGCCVEPSEEAFGKLQELYKDRKDVQCINVAIGEQNGTMDFWESGTHLNQGDTSLLSTLKKSEINKWVAAGNKFTKTIVPVWDVETLLFNLKQSKYEFISIDAEAMDEYIVKQLDLTKLGCECLCIEFNGDEKVLAEIKSYCAQFGLTNELLRNAENIIITI